MHSEYGYFLSLLSPADVATMVLFVRHSFGGLGSAVGAAVLVVANVGITQLMK